MKLDKFADFASKQLRGHFTDSEKIPGNLLKILGLRKSMKPEFSYKYPPTYCEYILGHMS